MERDNYISITSDEEFQIIITTSGDRLVVVDFFTTWCPPCQKIAPFFQQLSTQYPYVTFLKVDCDIFQQTAHSSNVTAYPTFHFYINGAKQMEIRGANAPHLEATIRSLSATAATASVTTKQQPEERSPYTYFPTKGFISFDATKNLTSIHNKLSQFNASIAGTSQCLNSEDISNVQKIISTLTNTSFYHASSFTKSEYTTVMKLLQWPPKICFPCLDMLRLIVLHPHAATHFAVSYENGGEDNVLDVCLSFLLCGESQPEANIIMIWRFLCNLFKEEKSRERMILQTQDQVIEFSKIYVKHTNQNITLAVVTLLLNLSVAFALGNSENRLSIVEILIENLETVTTTTYTEETLFRILLTLGTCAYKHDQCKTLIKQNFLKLQNLIQPKKEDVDKNTENQPSTVILALQELQQLVNN